MIRITTFKGKRVAVFGLGASGNSAAHALAAGGAEVVAWDDDQASREAAAKSCVPIRDLETADWNTFAALILAPGAPLTHPEPHWTVRKARAAGIEIIGDIELFCRERAKTCPGSPFIAITGTNGKSTTTALIAHMLVSLGHDAQMGGNIGRAILTLEPPAPNRFHVIEMSSFQIDLTPTLKPTVGVLLNISPDHLDRHGPASDCDLAMRNYAAIKSRLVENAETVAIGTEDEHVRTILEWLADRRARVLPFTAGKGAAVVPRLYAIGQTLFVHETCDGHAASSEITALSGIGTLRGRHNTQNALAALAALRGLQDRLDARPADAGHLRVWWPEKLADGLRSYGGLPHRMEEVGRAGKVVFINDSKATNADSAAKALASWPSDIYWILGGRAKEGGITTLTDYFPRITKAYLIGEASDAFAATLETKVVYERCIALDVATKCAAADAAHSQGAEPIVLLSPACASYDQFKAFDRRGDAFRELVALIPGVVQQPRGASR